MGVFFTSCVTYQAITIQVLQPAQKYLPISTKNIVVVNHSNYPKSQFTNQDNEEVKLNLDSLLSNEMIVGFHDALLNSQEYTIVNRSPVYIQKPSYNERFKSLKADIVSQICKDSVASALVSLENIQVILIPVSTNYNPENGYYTGKYGYVTSGYWKIYDSTGQVVFDDYIQKDTAIWEASGETTIEVNNNFPDLKSSLIGACYQSGENYARRISMLWGEENRTLITFTNADFINATNLANNGEWLKAIELWKKYPYGKNKTLAYYASYNLAVAAEVLDDLDAALEWAAKAYFLKKTLFVEEYILLLEQRKKEKQQIVNQNLP